MAFENVSIIFVSFDWVHDLSQLKIQASITPYTLRGYVRCLSLKIVSRQSTVLGSSHRMSKLLFSEDNLWGLLHLTNFDHGPISWPDHCPQKGRYSLMAWTNWFCSPPNWKLWWEKPTQCKWLIDQQPSWLKEANKYSLIPMTIWRSIRFAYNNVVMHKYTGSSSRRILKGIMGTQNIKKVSTSLIGSGYIFKVNTRQYKEIENFFKDQEIT